MLAILATEYHNVDPAKSLSQQMVEDGLLKRHHTPQENDKAAEEPTSHPRAQRRAYWINHDSPANRVSRVRWEDVTVNGRIRILEFD